MKEERVKGRKKKETRQGWQRGWTKRKIEREEEISDTRN